MSALSEPAAAPAAAPTPVPSSSLSAGWREQALAALEDGRVAEAHEWLRQALAEATELEWLNDFAVLSHQLGQHLAKELKTYLPKKAA